MKLYALFLTHRGKTHHWIAQRATAVILVPLGIWFVLAALNLIGNSRAETIHWAEDPLNIALFVVFLVVTYWHAALGVSEILTDYIHEPSRRVRVKQGVHFLLGISLGFGLVGLVMLALA